LGVGQGRGESWGRDDGWGYREGLGGLDCANLGVGGRGDDPATGKQMGYIAVMAQKAGEAKPAEGMGKTEASQKIGELKAKTGM
jgi:hypothetical protein